MSNVANANGIKLDDILTVNEDQTESTILQLEREIFETKATYRGPIPFKHLIWIPNVRSAACMLLAKMEHSLKTRGVLEDFPIVLSRRSKTKLAVLRGNRRTLAAANILEAEPEIFDMLMPNGDWPACIVLENLTEDEENILMIDHSADLDREPLDDEGLFVSVCRLMDSDITGQADIAAKLNLYKEKDGQLVPNRSYIQQRVNLAKLPDHVQEEYIKLMRGGTKATTVRWGQVPTLYSEWLKGRERGDVDGGIGFNEQWQKMLNPEKSTAVSMITKKTLEKKAEKFSSRNGLRFANLITGKEQVDDEGNPIDFQIIDAEMTEVERAADLLHDIAEFLGEAKFTKLNADVYKWRQKKTSESSEE